MIEHTRAAPVRLADGAKWQCANCGELVPYEQIINPRQCQCGSWSYRPIYDQAALAEADWRRSR